MPVVEERDDRLRRVTLVAAIGAAASPYVIHLWGHALGYFIATLLLPADIALAAVVMVWAPSLAAAVRRRPDRGRWRVGPGATGWLLLAAWMTVALAWHPAGRGVLTVWHLFGVAVVAFAVTSTIRAGHVRAVGGILCSLGVFETALALVQLAAGRQIGLSATGASLIEVPFRLFRFGGHRAPYGTFPHPYVLAGFALVAAVVATTIALDPAERRPLPWAAAGAVAAVPVGLTFSRTALLGVTLAGVCLIWAAARSPVRGRAAAVVLILALGCGVPAVLVYGGWRQRAVSSAAPGGDTGRAVKSHQALTLLADNLVIGVGPGRYVTVLEHRYPSVRGDQSADQAVHDLPLLAGVEGGLLGLVATAGALAWLGWRALRSGPLGLATYLVFVPFCVLDQFPYESGQGAVILAVWLGTVDAIVSSHCPATPA